jgi:hypothetical protein
MPIHTNNSCGFFEDNAITSSPLLHKTQVLLTDYSTQTTETKDNYRLPLFQQSGDLVVTTTSGSSADKYFPFPLLASEYEAPTQFGAHIKLHITSTNLYLHHYSVTGRKLISTLVTLISRYLHLPLRIQRGQRPCTWGNSI